MIAPLLLTLAVLTPPEGAERLGGDFIPCPDGTVVEREMYDPDPSDPNAAVILFKRGTHVLALVDTRTLTLTLASGEVVTLDRVGRRWKTACDLPMPVGMG